MLWRNRVLSQQYILVLQKRRRRLFINRINKEFWDARHNCTAFALGPKQEQQRSSDNGEPSGTAGKPMLEVLKKTGITNVAVVVTRYFGGIKLGAGGLIRAYSHSVAETLRLAPKELHTTRTQLQATIDYSLYGAIERYVQDQKLHYEASFGEHVDITILVPPTDVERIQKRAPRHESWSCYLYYIRFY